MASQVESNPYLINSILTLRYSTLCSLFVAHVQVHTFSRDAVNILQVSAQIARLSEGFLAEGALERSQSCVLSEVISEIAAFLEDATTLRISAFKVKLDSLGFWVFHPNRLVPLLRDAFEGLMLASS